MEELGPDVVVEGLGPLLDQAKAQVDVAEELPLHGRQEERPAVELARPSGVVEERGCDEQVAPQASVELRGVAAERRDGDGVLEQAARVAVVSAGRGRKRAKSRAELRVADESGDERAECRLGDLVREELEEAVELIDVATRRRNERGGVGSGRLERADVELEPVAEALDAGEDAHRVAFAEPPVEKLDVVPDASLRPSGCVDELEREIRAPRTRPEPSLPRDREDALDDAVGDEVGDRRRLSLAGRQNGLADRAHRRECRREGGRMRPWTGSLTWPPVARLKPFRALRYDTRRAGPLSSLVAPPHDVITRERRDSLLAANPYNCVRLIRPETVAEAARTFGEWREEGILVREGSSAAWFLAEDFVGPDGLPRTRHAIVARVRLAPYGAGVVLPHERTLEKPKEERLELLRAVRTKLSPVLLLHEGGTPAVSTERPPELEAELDGLRSRAWRIDDVALQGVLEAVSGRTIIADGHHRYETALRFHEEEKSEETAYVLAALVSRSDPGLLIFPTHRLASGPVPELNGRFRLTSLAGGAADAVARLGLVPRDRPAFVVLKRDGAVLAEAEPKAGPVEILDTAAIDELRLPAVHFTPSAAEAERAVRTGAASAAFLVRPPTIEQVEAVALAGETMPEKSTYFFPKLMSGLLFSPLDE